jgi:DNA-binding IclR family transcriptional regulator
MLLLIAQNDEGLSVKEISTGLNISRQVTYHMLHTLTARRVVSRTGQGRYILGLRVGALTQGFQRQIFPGNELAPVVRRVAKETGEVCGASGRWQGAMMNFYIFGGPRDVVLRDGPYEMQHPHGRAAGKLLMAMCGPDERSAFLDKHPLKALTKNTITDRRVFERELDRIRSQGYATEVEESDYGMCSLAVPLDEDMTLPFCIGLTSHTERFTAEMESYVGIMKKVIASQRGW